MSVEETIRQAMAPFANNPIPEDPHASLFELGVIDSFGLMDLLNALEEALGVHVPDADLVPKRFETISKIADYFESNGKPKS